MLSGVQVASLLVLAFGGRVDAHNAALPPPPAAATGVAYVSPQFKYQTNSASLGVLVSPCMMTREDIARIAEDAFSGMAANFKHGTRFEYSYTHMTLTFSGGIQVTLTLTYNASA